MSRMIRAMQVLVGLVLVAAGAGLAAPFISRLVTANATSRSSVVAAASDRGHRPVQRESDRQVTAPVFAVPANDLAGVTQSADGWRLEKQPGVRLEPVAPPPPPRLPPPSYPLAPMAGSPILSTTYRSTLDVPPPPLLDVQAGPPRAGPLPGAAPSVAASPTIRQPAGVPGTYVIRDGDDLTGLAARLYGHPRAARAIWAANREQLADPDVLPIGAVLQLPPPWIALDVLSVNTSIEPQSSGSAADEETNHRGLP